MAEEPEDSDSKTECGTARMLIRSSNDSDYFSTSFMGSEEPQHTSTPILEDIPTNRWSNSPLSPTRYSRLQEKQDMQNLNDRLANYIEKVHQLEHDNSRLTRELDISQQIITREISSIKSIYEHEISDSRSMLMDESREKAKLEIDVKRLWGENQDLKEKLNKKSEDLKTLEHKLAVCESHCAELQSQIKRSETELKKQAEHELKLEIEEKRVTGLLEDARKRLGEEMLQRLDLQHQVHSLKEYIRFKEYVFQQELNESRAVRQTENSRIETQLVDQYEERLQRCLQKLIQRYGTEMREHRKDIEMMYDNKIKNLLC